MLTRSVTVAFVVAFMTWATSSPSQLEPSAAEPVRVTVSINSDGSRTVYEFDAPRQRATATTTAKDGKLVGRIRYTLDEAGRFASGEVYGPDDQFRFRTLYKYDDSGKLIQETQLGQGDAVRNKIVYAYDKNGKQTGYTVYDTAGKVLRRMPPETAPKRTPPSKRR